MDISNEDYKRFLVMAKVIAGKDAQDILHDSLIKIEGKFIRDFDSYLFRTMKNCYLDFLKREKKIALAPIVEYFETETPSIDYLNQVLLQLENEGYKEQVAIFKEAYFVSNRHKVAKRTKRNYKTVSKYCRFIQEEIKKRYDDKI
jgi:DNA-directed RNA polymerase specialized sigma24 family protein